MKRPLILLTNDDGIYAPGIFSLWKNISLYADVIVAAPNTEKSAASHAITILKPIQIKKINREDGFKGFSIKGTPADCVKVAFQTLLPQKPDFVISGINRGSNLGSNILYSGTVSAAAEGHMQGVPSIAISLDSHKPKDYNVATYAFDKVFKSLLESKIKNNILLNINVPNCLISSIKGFKITEQGNQHFQDNFELNKDPYDNNYVWMSGKVIDEDLDIRYDGAAVRSDYVSITPLEYKLSRHQDINLLKNNLNI